MPYKSEKRKTRMKFKFHFSMPLNMHSLCPLINPWQNQTRLRSETHWQMLVDLDFCSYFEANGPNCFCVIYFCRRNSSPKAFFLDRQNARRNKGPSSSLDDVIEEASRKIIDNYWMRLSMMWRICSSKRIASDNCHRGRYDPRAVPATNLSTSLPGFSTGRRENMRRRLRIYKPRLREESAYGTPNVFLLFRVVICI